MTNSVLGIVGGSGVYDIEMDNARWERVDSPWGLPSDEVRRGEIGGCRWCSCPVMAGVTGCHRATSTTAPTSTS
jgi:purine nucleoside phosphorylase